MHPHPAQAQTAPQHRRKAVTVIVQHPEAHLNSVTRIDNNCAENAIRPAKLVMKNWLFIGHPDAGQRSAILHSLVLSCKRHGKDSFAYLRDVLTRLPTMRNQDKIQSAAAVQLDAAPSGLLSAGRFVARE